jgi:hypothetical protein
MNNKQKLESIEYDHNEMVKRLVKKPSLILEEMTNEKCAVLHAILGIMSELGEIGQMKNEENLLEETGDFLFYVRDKRNVLPWLGKFTPIPVPYFSFVGAFEELADIAKRFIIHNTPWVDSEGEKKPKLLATRLRTVINTVESFACINLERHTRKTRADALVHNMNKLEKGDNARYKDGYSDSAANARADKGDDDDLGELDASKACKVNDPGCESCQ